MKLSDLTPKQIERARAIFEAALPFGVVAVAAALMTAAAESSYWLYANDGTTKRADVPARAREVARESLSYEYDRVAPNMPPETPAGTWDTTADSVGHFQQRPTYGYGTVADLMDPAESTRIFLRGSKSGRTRYFLESPEALSLPQRCQWTQGSEYPTGENYAPMADVTAQLISLFTRGKDWFDMATKEEVQAAFTDALAPVLQRLDRIEANTTEDKPRLSLVRNVDTGEIFAYGPGQFDHVGSMEELDYGRNIGLYTRSPWLDTDTAGIEVFRGLATEGSGADQKKEN